jgi:uncharacterized membrane protein
MEIKLNQYWYNIKSSLWFLPTIMALSALGLAFSFIALDNHVNYDNLQVVWFIYGGQGEGARSVLSTIAASMVTISGVTFSITLVALTMASAQFGPRLLRNFIADKGNQFVIGTFIATFIYSLIVLLTIRGSGEDEFVPKISVIFAFLLAIFSLGVIIYFIHHVTSSIQADFVIKSSYKEFKSVAGNFLLGEEAMSPISYNDELKKVKNEFSLSTKVCFQTSGYIQSIDYKNSGEWAQRNDAVVEWLVYPGLFATVKDEFAVVYHKSSLPEKASGQLQNSIVINYQRTPNQDLLFSLKQIAEVGVRALSPGINDPHTAVTCIQWLGSALSELSGKSLDTPVMTAKDKKVRVLCKQITFQMIVDTCFDHLRLYAKPNMYVIVEMLNALEKPLFQTKNNEFRQVLKEKATIIYKEYRQEFGSDLSLIDKQYQKIIQHH